MADARYKKDEYNIREGITHTSKPYNLTKISSMLWLALILWTIRFVR